VATEIHSRDDADARPPRFEDLWSECAPAVAAWLELHVRDSLRPHLDPEDALQEVACRAFDGFARFDPAAGPFRAWLFGIARHVLYQALQRVGRQLTHVGAASDRSFDTQAWSRLPDTTTSITRRVARDESLRRFVAEVRALDDDDRRLLLRRGLEGLAHEDIARELGITTDAAIKRWTRLRERLSTAPRFVQLAS